MGNNDTVPKPSLKVPFQIKVTVATLQAFSPSLASNFLTKLFFTPVKYTTPERETPFKYQCALHRETINGKRITVYHKGQSGPNILFTHGWSGRGTQFYRIAEALVKKGYRITLFTAPAHGSSDDKTTDLLEFVQAIEFVNQKFGPFLVGVGHSLGGVATVNAFSNGASFKGIVTIGTPATVQSVIDDFCDLTGANGKTKAMMIKRLEKKYQRHLEVHAPFEIMKTRDVPGLIIHDEDDRDSPIASAHLLKSVWPSATTFITKGLGHRKILGDDAVIAQICDFVDHIQQTQS
ncbi:MAG: alpha/beta hydrolase [Schleiferiaceae bacterium]|nr:alpha/beta hydrolase [Schleiferiaceae bacterium]